MVRTLRQRQADWRGRRDMKSALFDILNAERVRSLRETITPDNKPEAKALAEFFISYPRCYKAPQTIAIDYDKGLLGAFMRSGENTDQEAAAAYVGLSEISSMPVKIVWLGANPPAIPVSDELVDLVRKEVDELRRLNLWGAL
ncbi:Hypothetical protein NGAL_HAMBI2427_59860 [Neorhizobium galegae bv. orientalis]|nr:Hypothetical protein NGAL_HAMBI2427_59860 [Neorhizobium galegae bv. orientalis]